MSESEWAQLKEWLPLLIPIILLQLALTLAALIDLARRSQARGPKWLWAVIILFGSTLGPIIYFVIGRDEG